MGRVKLTCVSLAFLAVVAPLTATADDVTVLTFNLRSRLDDPDRREPIIAAYLASVRPDVVLLQEVANVSGPDLTQAHRMARVGGYEVSTCFNQKSERGLAVLSRFPIVDSVILTYAESDRPILGVTLNVRGRLVSVVDVHLTPAMELGSRRRGELDMALRLLADLPNGTLVAGDFNFGDGAPESALLRPLVDAWRVVEPSAPGHTWDHRNPLARKNSFPMEPSRRLDRIMLTESEPKVSACRIVLDAPTASGTWPSDHFGVLATLSFLEANLAGAPSTRPAGADRPAAAQAPSH